MFNQGSAFLTQNNLLDSNQSGFRSGHSTETVLLSVVEALRLARADSKSSILLLLYLSAAFDKVNHQILLSTLLAKGISGTTIQWFESYLSDRSFKVSRGVQIATSSYRGAPGLSSWTSSLLCLHGITVIQKHGFPYHCYADDTHLSFHPDDHFDNFLHLSLSNRHFLLDEGPSPSTQPCQNRTACGWSKPIVSSQFHHPARHINHNSFKNSQKLCSCD